ncbi:MAG: NifU family protein [Pseudomonadota bacterium]
MFIQTEDTPNPQSMKFLPGQAVLGAGEMGMDFPTAETAEAGSALAALLFETDGVMGVYLGADFVTVTKTEAVEWMHIKPAILGALADYLSAGLPVLKEGVKEAAPATDLDDYEGEDRETVEQIIELIETRVRPAVAADGGDIVFQHFEPKTGVVFLSMRGACAGCPSSTMTLKAGIENMLKHYVPEVVKVEAAV